MFELPRIDEARGEGKALFVQSEQRLERVGGRTETIQGQHQRFLLFPDRAFSHVADSGDDGCRSSQEDHLFY